MNFLSHLGIRVKLAAGFALVLAMLGTVSVLSYRDLAHLRTTQSALFDDDFALTYNLMSLRNAINRERLLLLALTTTDATPAMTAALEQRGAEVRRLLGQLEQAKQGEDRLTVGKLARLLAAHDDYAALRDRQIGPLLAAGKRAEASALIVGPLAEKYTVLRDSAEAIGEEQWSQARARMGEAGAVVAGAQRSLAWANLVALLLAVLLIWWFDRSVALPLRRTTEVAGQIAGGDLTVSVPAASGRDEVQQLLAALASMVASWRGLMAQTHAGIVTLASSSGEILAATMQSAAGAAQTATAVTETSATVEEVKQTARLATQKARLVADAAQLATSTATDGRAALDAGLEGMRSAHTKMESIAETVVRLSERSETIGEIIVTVGGLAEQSNLLAVNAAIEAAKAGEQGKGFGVVAQEVRSLAEQSKEATRQVRQILSDVQKSIGAAVMLAEQGARTVAQGVERAGAADAALRILAEQVDQAAQAAVQIAASSQQQLAGMDQVALAMDNINQASSDHAAASRQSENAAKSLHQLGEQLRAVSARFTV